MLQEYAVRMHQHRCTNGQTTRTAPSRPWFPSGCATLWVVGTQRISRMSATGPQCYDASCSPYLSME